MIKEAGAQLSLRLNASMCKIIAKNTTKQFESSAIEGFQIIELDHLCLLGAPILRQSATGYGQVSQGDVRRTEKRISKLAMLQAHDAIIILKNSLSILKLMYILRTTDCCDNEFLTQFDNIVSKGLSTVLNWELLGD